MNLRQPDTEVSARRLVVGGRVQGVGFRPFVYRTACALGLQGWVRNETGQVVIHVEGETRSVDLFARSMIDWAPPLARPHLEASELTSVEGSGAFCIQASLDTDQPDVRVPPDLFCCGDCTTELQDPTERRYRYPFTNCTQCGPRYTIIQALPYDRPNTSMAGFVLCPACAREYSSPHDRRFHAQPLACPACGPSISFHQAGQDARKAACCGEEALAAAVTRLRMGLVVAVKGVGGYHLMCDAAGDDAVRRLRELKRRPHKPLAIMFPQRGADGLAAVRAQVDLSQAEAFACADPARPIVLATRRRDCSLSALLAPGLAELGVFLPYSPLHHLLLGEFGGPLVATSGNVGGEPVITDNTEAAARLSGVADAFLHHDRPILRPADDSVVRVINGEARPIRLGRGVAPLEVDLPGELREPTLAVGGHLKATIALGWGRRAVVSPHIGDLDSPRSLAVLQQVIADLQALYRVRARRIVCDAHPGYGATRWARAQGLPVIPVQHHAAHASALAGEHADVDRWLVFTWDGLGLGDDGDLWGGETLLGRPGAWRRVASLRPFHVLGADQAGREAWRSAAALMWECARPWAPPGPDGALAFQAWRKRLGTSRTSSVGRLFDAAAALALGVQETSFEGQGPMLLESVATREAESVALPLDREGGGLWRTDWEPLLPMLCDSELSQAQRAGIFHESLAQAAMAQAIAIAALDPVDAVGLTGGVFQNRLLAERLTTLLAQRGFRVHLPRLVPANDGGLALGQLVETLGRDTSSASAAGG